MYTRFRRNIFLDTDVTPFKCLLFPYFRYYSLYRKYYCGIFYLSYTSYRYDLLLKANDPPEPGTLERSHRPSPGSLLPQSRFLRSDGSSSTQIRDASQCQPWRTFGQRSRSDSRFLPSCILPNPSRLPGARDSRASPLQTRPPICSQTQCSGDELRRPTQIQNTQDLDTENSGRYSKALLNKCSPTLSRTSHVSSEKKTSLTKPPFQRTSASWSTVTSSFAPNSISQPAHLKVTSFSFEWVSCHGDALCIAMILSQLPLPQPNSHQSFFPFSSI